MDAFKTQPTARVDERYISDKPWPKHPVPITLKNLGEDIIQYRYSEDGVVKDGSLNVNQIGPNPTTFSANHSYMFNLRTGDRIEQIP